MRRRNSRSGPTASWAWSAEPRGWDPISFYYDMTTWMDAYIKDFTGSIRPFIGGGWWAPPKLQEARNAASASFKHMQEALAEEYGVSLTKARK